MRHLFKKWWIWINGDLHKTDQQGIMQRYLNEKDHWDIHLEHCKKYIENSIGHGGEKVAVLGSGWLLDVPLDTLLKKYKEVHLYDIHHPSQIKHKFRSQKQIVFHTLDLTNGLNVLFERCKSIKEVKKAAIQLPKPLNFAAYDKVISLNILNQLDNLLIDKLTYRFKLEPQFISSLKKRIQQQHLDSLPKNQSVLITDFLELNFDLNKDITNSTPLIFCDLSKFHNYEEWIWVFDTHKNYRSKYSTHLHVGAVLL